MNHKIPFKMVQKAFFAGFCFLVLFGSACAPIAETSRSTIPSPLTAEKYNKIMREGKAAYTSREAEAAAAEMGPFVEQFTGKKIVIFPIVKLVNRNPLVEILFEELKTQYADDYPGYSKEQINSLASRNAKRHAASFLGKYDEKENILYLMPTNLDSALRLLNIERKHIPAILRLLAAHELTHALQHQETNLRRLDQITKLDERLALLAVCEGHAIFVGQQIAEELGWQEPFTELLKFFSSESVVFSEPLLEISGNISSRQNEQKYLNGKKFIEYHYAQGGNDRIWQILAHPPVKTSMVIHPETYRTDRPDEIDCAVLFEDFEKSFGSGDWISQNMEMGEMILNSFLVDLDSNDREEMVSQILQAQFFISENSKENKKLSVMAWIIKDPLFIGKGVGFLEQTMRKRFQELQDSTLVSVQDYLAEDVAALDADKAVKITFWSSLKIPFLPSLQYLMPKKKEVILYAGKNNVIIGFCPIGMDMTDEGMLNMVKIVFDQYELVKTARR